jgi:hypothetical protein
MITLRVVAIVVVLGRRRGSACRPQKLADAANTSTDVLLSHPRGSWIWDMSHLGSAVPFHPHRRRCRPGPMGLVAVIIVVSVSRIVDNRGGAQHVGPAPRRPRRPTTPPCPSPSFDVVMGKSCLAVIIVVCHCQLSSTRRAKSRPGHPPISSEASTTLISIMACPTL